MARYRKIDPRIWNDAKFNSLSVQGKLAFFFMLTHPNMTAVGAMRISIQGLVAELDGVGEKGFQEVFDKGLAKGDNNHCFIRFPNFLKYNKPESPNVVKSWLSALDLLPECESKLQLIQEIKDFLKDYNEGFREVFAKDFAYTGAGAGAGAGVKQPLVSDFSEDALHIANEFIREWSIKFTKIKYNLNEQAAHAEKLLKRYKRRTIVDVLEAILNHGDDKFSWMDQVRSLAKLSKRPPEKSIYHEYSNWMDVFMDQFKIK